MGNCWDQFDIKFALGHTNNLNRMSEMKRELTRVGLSGVEWHMQFPNPFDSLVIKYLPLTGTCKARPHYININQGHYRMVKLASALGADKGLFMEDDLVFLRDVSLIDDIMRRIPADADVVLLDSFSRKNEAMRMKFACDLANKNGTDRFFKRITHAYSAACYVLNRRAMDRFINMMEDPVTKGTATVPVDWFFDTDRYLHGMSLYAATPNVAVQDVRLKSCRAGTYCVNPITFADYNFGPSGKPRRVTWG